MPKSQVSRILKANAIKAHFGLKKKIDFTKKTIAVIGTGSSGMQLIPEVAKSAEKLYVLQRTPNYSVPAHNKSLDPDFVQEFKKNYKKNMITQMIQPVKRKYDVLLERSAGTFQNRAKGV